MVVLQNGLNKIRDLHRENLDYAWVGTSGTAIYEAQTGLQAGVAATILEVTKAFGDKTNTFNYTLPSTAGTATTYQEFGTLENGGTAGTNYDRVIFTGVMHTSNDDFIVKKIYYYRNP